MYSVNVLLLCTGLLISFGSAYWSFVEFLRDKKLKKELRQAGAPHSKELWITIQWRRPYRRIVPDMLVIVGFAMMWHSSRPLPNAPDKIVKDYLQTLCMVNSLFALSLVGLIASFIFAWRRDHPNENGPSEAD